MDPFYLELYQDRRKLPDAFIDLPGAAAYDVNDPAEYFAVLLPEPADGTPQSAYLAPVPPDATVAAWTHGTDTLPPGTASFMAASVCVWAPRTRAIPYGFEVFAPNGTAIDLVNVVPGSDDRAWYCAPVPEAAGSVIGVWRVRVRLKAAAGLPVVHPPRHAALNPTDLAFPPTQFERQPLLLVKGPRPVCATLNGIAVTAGCAAPNGQVSLAADVTNPDRVVEWNWSFGDGTPSPPGAGQTVTHTYAANPTGPASLTIVRESGCVPLTETRTVDVTPCDCPRLTGMEIVSGCAPGTVTFRAAGQNLASAEGFLWNFGDGSTGDTPGPEASHDYALAPAAPGSVTASVAVVSPSRCAPSPPQSMAVRACCPVLTGVQIVSGCAPGSVAFRAFGQNIGAALRFHWTFGDGTEMDTDGPDASHTYAGAPAGPGALYASVSMVSPGNCPLSPPQRVEVPGCPVRCPQLRDIRIVSDNRCAPGTVRLQADVDEPSLVQQWNWQFGDGGSSHDAVTTEHTYATAGPFHPSLTIVRDARCRPIESGPRSTTVSPCPVRDERSTDWPDASLPSVSCLLALLLIAAAILAGLILFPVGFCVCIDTGYTGWGFVAGLIMLIAGAVLLAVGAGLFLAWLLVCGPRPGFCPILNFLWEFILVVLVPIATIVAAIVTILLQWCGLPVAFDAVYLTFLGTMALWAARCLGCTDWPAWMPNWVRDRLPCL